MKMILAGISAVLLAAVYLPTMDTRRANPEAAVNASVPRTAPGGRILLAQAVFGATTGGVRTPVLLSGRGAPPIVSR